MTAPDPIPPTIIRARQAATGLLLLSVIIVIALVVVSGAAMSGARTVLSWLPYL